MFLLLGLGLKTLQAFLNVSLFLRLQDRPRTWYFSSAFAMIYIVAQRAPSFFITYIFDIQTVCSKHGNRHPCSSLSLPPKSIKEASMFNLPLRGCISSRYECLLSYLGLESQLYIQIWSRETSFLSLSLPRALKFLESANFKCFSHFGPLSQNISVGIQRLSLSLPPK